MIEDLSLHILDIAENAIVAGATRVFIAVNENGRRDLLAFRIIDNGRGMPREERERALDPFFTTKGKRTGLGLPLLAQTAGQCGGQLAVESVPKRGTRINARFRLSHIDRPPLTKMAATVAMLVFGYPAVDLRYRHTRNGKRFDFRSRAFLSSADVDQGLSPEAIAAVRKALESGLKRIGVS